jgi:hypothetical protein
MKQNKGTSNKQAVLKNQKKGPRKRSQYLDPQYLAEHWRMMLEPFESQNVAFTPFDRTLAKQKAQRG